MQPLRNLDYQGCCQTGTVSELSPQVDTLRGRSSVKHAEMDAVCREDWELVCLCYTIGFYAEGLKSDLRICAKDHGFRFSLWGDCPNV